ncbi:MAG: hypothetical protein RJA22_1502 [Verrucomicrobiota bacterium]|jgi:hydroxymethylbilane synthase
MPASPITPVRIATRGSALALAQANTVLALCQAALPGRACELRVIKTTGDKLQTASLTSGDLPKGLFTKELETAMLAGEADLAVHSLKDLPTELPPGLKLGAVLPRADVRDVLVFRHAEWMAGVQDLARPVRPDRRGFKPSMSIQGLPHGATVGTSSARRAAQARALRPDLNIVPLRGNVGTRLRKLVDQLELDAILLAAAGLERLGVHWTPGGLVVGPDVPEGLGASHLSFGEMLPCVGQGAIGLETRQNDPAIDALCAVLNHVPTWNCVTAERSFLAAMGGGCAVPVAGLAECEEDRLRLRAVSFLGGQPRRGEVVGGVGDAAPLGATLAAQLR